MNSINNSVTVCPSCGGSRVHRIDSTLFYCLDCKKQIISIMKKTDLKEEDNLNKKKPASDMVDDCDCGMQDAYSALKYNVAEGYENVEVGSTFEMINE